MFRGKNGEDVFNKRRNVLLQKKTRCVSLCKKGEHVSLCKKGDELPGASVPTVAAHQLPLFLGSLASQASVRLSPTIVPAVEASIKVGTSTTVRN